MTNPFSVCHHRKVFLLVIISSVIFAGVKSDATKLELTIGDERVQTGAAQKTEDEKPRDGRNLSKVFPFVGGNPGIPRSRFFPNDQQLRDNNRRNHGFLRSGSRINQDILDPSLGNEDNSDESFDEDHNTVFVEEDEADGSLIEDDSSFEYPQPVSISNRPQSELNLHTRKGTVNSLRESFKRFQLQKALASKSGDNPIQTTRVELTESPLFEETVELSKDERRFDPVTTDVEEIEEGADENLATDNFESQQGDDEDQFQNFDDDDESESGFDDQETDDTFPLESLESFLDQLIPDGTPEEEKENVKEKSQFENFIPESENDQLAPLDSTAGDDIEDGVGVAQGGFPGDGNNFFQIISATTEDPILIFEHQDDSIRFPISQSDFTNESRVFNQQTFEDTTTEQQLTDSDNQSFERRVNLPRSELSNFGIQHPRVSSFKLDDMILNSRATESPTEEFERFDQRQSFVPDPEPIMTTTQEQILISTPTTESTVGIFQRINPLVNRNRVRNDPTPSPSQVKNEDQFVNFKPTESPIQITERFTFPPSVNHDFTSTSRPQQPRFIRTQATQLNEAETTTEGVHRFTSSQNTFSEKSQIGFITSEVSTTERNFDRFQVKTSQHSSANRENSKLFNIPKEKENFITRNQEEETTEPSESPKIPQPIPIDVVSIKSQPRLIRVQESTLSPLPSQSRTETERLNISQTKSGLQSESLVATNLKADNQEFINGKGRRIGPPESRVPKQGPNVPDPDLDLGAIALAGEKCIDKVVMVEETEYDDVIDCKHSYNERCHTTYTTDFEPQQEEACDDNFKKQCFIEYKKKSIDEKVQFCHTPLICDGDGPVECKTVHETECQTKFHEHQVEDDVVDCETLNEEKCETLTQGYTSEQKCTKWPKQVCKQEKQKVSKYSPETECKKVPRELCGPSGCNLRPGPQECFEKTEVVIQEVPEESCNLEPQHSCQQITKLVPLLKAKEECVDVPKEVCSRSKTNPRKILKPVVKKWCYNPTKESGLA